MIEFLGTPLLRSDFKDPKQVSVAQICGLSDERAKELIDAFSAARQTAFDEGTSDPQTGLGTGGFSPALMLANTEVDLVKLGEVFMAGIIAGQICHEVSVKADEQNKRVTKMLHLMATDPAKALRKMKKDIAKMTGRSLERDQKASQDNQ